MSAPTPATGDGSPTPGYYPDPSIPGYVRYWNGTSWVPGTSRPAPKGGDATPSPPPSAAAAHAPAAASVEETGPVFLDEAPEAPAGVQPPASAWHADASQQTGFGGDLDRRVSWGSQTHGADLPGAGSQAASAPAPGQAWDRPAAVQDGPAAGVADSGASGPSSGVRVRRTAASGHQDPRAETAAETASGTPPADPTGGALPGVRSVAGAAAEQEPQPTDGTMTTPGLHHQGDAPSSEGTMTMRTMTPPKQPPPARTPPPRGSGAQVGEEQDPAHPVTAPPQRAAQVPVQQQAKAPAQQRAPMSAGVGGGAASWAQQARPLDRQGEEPPVVPWKPPVNDPFLQAAQAQAAARPAALGKRFAARLIDTVVLGAVVAVVSAPFVSGALTHIDEKIQAAKTSGETVTVWLIDGTTGVQFGVVLVALLALGALYEALPTAKWGRTLGKRLMGLEVRDIESHGPPSFAAALLRWLVHGMLGVLLVGTVNVLWCLFDRPWRQCWHDKAAHTFVAG
ncbi:RDD family protein [Streptomyces sp. NPDC059176]|uniref:RDD family protein n=1 Tax=unclassified Streptomyces TaxID=2593676 RepID=UPI0036CCDC3F